MDFGTDKSSTGRREDSDRKDQAVFKNHLLPFMKKNFSAPENDFGMPRMT